MDAKQNQWEKLLERIECGETTVDDAVLVRDLLDKVADLEQMLSECMGADIVGAETGDFTDSSLNLSRNPLTG